MDIRTFPARRRMLAAGAALAVACTLTACGSPASPPETTGTATPTATDTPQTPTARPGPRDAGRLIAAGKTARDAVGHGTVTSLDLSDDRSTWEVDVTASDGTEYEVHVSADGTQVRSGPEREHHSEAEKQKHQRRARAAKIDFADAARRILAHQPGTITELELDTEDGTVVWEADVRRDGTKHKVTIDAVTGKIIAASRSHHPDHHDTDGGRHR